MRPKSLHFFLNLDFLSKFEQFKKKFSWNHCARDHSHITSVSTQGGEGGSENGNFYLLDV